mmetsp:Transcript_26794/g.54610  ORF Transcript_26794/g.54610 Transcript_26794/m.54610 type:complete len:222 (-) Transcript_26794:27-692(-)
MQKPVRPGILEQTAVLLPPLTRPPKAIFARCSIAWAWTTRKSWLCPERTLSDAPRRIGLGWVRSPPSSQMASTSPGGTARRVLVPRAAPHGRRSGSRSTTLTSPPSPTTSPTPSSSSSPPTRSSSPIRGSSPSLRATPSPRMSSSRITRQRTPSCLSSDPSSSLREASRCTLTRARPTSRQPSPDRHVWGGIPLWYVDCTQETSRSVLFVWTKIAGSCNCF